MTREDIVRMAKEAGMESFNICVELDDFAKLVAEHEREACAEICDGFYLSWIDIQGRYEFMGEGASECAGAIRARSKE
jgi:hypothetical protein